MSPSDGYACPDARDPSVNHKPPQLETMETKEELEYSEDSVLMIRPPSPVSNITAGGEATAAWCPARLQPRMQKLWCEMQVAGCKCKVRCRMLDAGCAMCY